MNIAGTLPSAIAPAIAPVILMLDNGSYSVLYAVAASSLLVFYLYSKLTNQLGT